MKIRMFTLFNDFVKLNPLGTMSDFNHYLITVRKMK